MTLPASPASQHRPRAATGNLGGVGEREGADIGRDAAGDAGAARAGCDRGVVQAQSRRREDHLPGVARAAGCGRDRATRHVHGGRGQRNVAEAGCRVVAGVSHPSPKPKSSLHERQVGRVDRDTAASSRAVRTRAQRTVRQRHRVRRGGQPLDGDWTLRRRSQPPCCCW